MVHLSEQFRLTERDRSIWKLAVPALGALVAEPLYILADTAVVGNIGTPELGGLALASQVLLILSAIFIFLAYGTTAAVSRLLGAGKEREAAHNAVQSLWLALGLGVVFASAAYVAATPLLRALNGEGEILRNAEIYLRVSALGIPAMLLMLAGVGYLRGLQDTLRPLIVAIITAIGNLVLEVVLIFGFGFGIGASALATVVAQYVGASLYLLWIGRAVMAQGVSLAPDFSVIRRLAVAGADLLVRTIALRGSFTIATAVAAGMGAVELAAHEVVFALWSLVAFVLDSIAIAGQAMVGTHLGAGNADEARAVGRRITQWGVVLGIGAAIVMLALRPVLPTLFTNDAAVIETAAFLFWFLAVMQPVNGVVFALDGVLIGAGDLRFLAWAMGAAGILFIPVALAIGRSDLGIGWLWAALCAFMVLRMVGLGARIMGDKWLVTGS